MRLVGSAPRRLGLLRFALVLSLVGGTAMARLPDGFGLGDKTLVAWVRLADLEQQGCSALTVDDQAGNFDGLVYGELAQRRWMPGSEFYHRTPPGQAQQAWPEEGAGPDQSVQVAAIYEGGEVRLYRDGEPYAGHTVEQPLRFAPGHAIVMGLRHLGNLGEGSFLVGEIEEARLYAEALSQEEGAGLRLGEASEGNLIGWWTFEDGEGKDLVGNYPPPMLFGGARIEAGALKLGGPGDYLVAQEGQEPDPLHFRPKLGGAPIPSRYGPRDSTTSSTCWAERGTSPGSTSSPKTWWGAKRIAASSWGRMGSSTRMPSSATSATRECSGMRKRGCTGWS